jgi:hypothetical protein
VLATPDGPGTAASRLATPDEPGCSSTGRPRCRLDLRSPAGAEKLYCV